MSARSWQRPVLLGLAALAIGLGLWQIGASAAIQAKAWLAYGLIERAWQQTKESGQPARPWPWADTWPVARLSVPARGIEHLVLAGGSGRTLAFGPGHLEGTAAPGLPGHSIIGGHRDTHFRFLKDLRAGDTILLERPEGATRRYRVQRSDIVDSRHARVLPAEAGRSVLSLVTCYPFDTPTTGGPLRFVVTAEAFSPRE